jgi:hypothetical protein
MRCTDATAHFIDGDGVTPRTVVDIADVRTTITICTAERCGLSLGKAPLNISS